MNAFLKNTAYSLLPEGILRKLKNVHYNRQFKAFDIISIPEYEIISRLVPSGSTVLDIGANIGLFSKCFSLIVGSRGKVYSLEPVPQTYGVLCSNIELLKPNNVESMNYAASDAEETVTMIIPTYQSRHGVDARGNVYEGKGENYYEAKIISGEADLSAKQVTVQTKKIDSLFFDTSKNISFIKCDVEGHEFPCILGSLKIIKRDQPALLIEIMKDPKSDSSSGQLFRILQEEGYQPFCLHDHFLKQYDGQTKDINFFFLKPHHVQLVSSLIVS